MEIYRGLLYAHLREAHDRIYFGAWRGSSTQGVTDPLGPEHCLARSAGYVLRACARTKG